MIRNKKTCKGRGKYQGLGCGLPRYIFSNGLCQYCIPKNAPKKPEIFKVKPPENKDEKLAIKYCHLYIRERDKGRPCISCGTGKPEQAGHYWSGGNYPALKFDEKNINGQCFVCNCVRGSNHNAYTIGMIAKYGQAQVQILEIRRHEKYEHDYIAIAEYYKQKYEALTPHRREC